VLPKCLFIIAVMPGGKRGERRRVSNDFVEL
jgi:hypothetical protein